MELPESRDVSFVVRSGRLATYHLPVDVRVGGGVIQVHTNGVLHVGLVEVRCQVRWWGRVVRWVTDVVGTTAAEATRESVVMFHNV